MDVCHGFFLKKDRACSFSWPGCAKLKRTQNQWEKKRLGFPTNHLIPLDPTVYQPLSSELKVWRWRRAEPLPTKHLQWESDAPIKQTIATEDGHRFNGCVNAVKVRESTKERVLRPSGEVRGRFAGRCRAAEM